MGKGVIFRSTCIYMGQESEVLTSLYIEENTPSGMLCVFYIIIILLKKTPY